MCGRDTFRSKPEAVAEHFHLPEPPTEPPRFNVAPSQAVPVIRDVTIERLRWGLVPSWAKEPKVGFSNINARCESVAQSGAFRSAFKRRRCLLLADGFFEWFPGPPKVPHYFRLREDGPFAFAGIWERWGDDLETVALITTQANNVVGPVHHRMPVILDYQAYPRWLDPEASPEELQALMKPYPAEEMVGYAVSDRVNRPQNDEPGCIEPVG
jgi:putative SOS response-associated peptidase YedK